MVYMVKKKIQINIRKELFYIYLKDIKNINALYLSFSQSIFASLGEDDIEWIGNLCESEDLEDEESAPEYYELKKGIY